MDFCFVLLQQANATTTLQKVDHEAFQLQSQRRKVKYAAICTEVWSWEFPAFTLYLAFYSTNIPLKSQGQAKRVPYSKHYAQSSAQNDNADQPRFQARVFCKGNGSPRNKWVHMGVTAHQVMMQLMSNSNPVTHHQLEIYIPLLLVVSKFYGVL